jgi:hypothetical protein
MHMASFDGINTKVTSTSAMLRPSIHQHLRNELVQGGIRTSSISDYLDSTDCRVCVKREAIWYLALLVDKLLGW